MPHALGVTLVEGGASIAVFSQNASRVEVCLYDAQDRETQRIILPERRDHVHIGFIPGISAGQRYGLRADGPFAPDQGHRFDAAKLLVDPYARRLDRAFAQAVFSFVPPGLIQRSVTFRQGEGLIAGKISPEPALLRFGARITEEGGADVPATWASPR